MQMKKVYCLKNNDPLFYVLWYKPFLKIQIPFYPLVPKKFENIFRYTLYLSGRVLKDAGKIALQGIGFLKMLGFIRFRRRCGFVLALTGVALLLGSCQLAKNQLEFDRSANLDRQDYRDGLQPISPPAANTAPIPDFQPVLSTPEELRLPSPLVTVSVNQTVSLRDLLFELAEQAGIDLELDPQIHGSVIFTAKERPFDEVVNRICEMSGLRYKFNRDVLRIELDRPYIKTYGIGFLNIDRKGESKIDTSVSLSSGSGNGTGGGSSSKVETKYQPDLWKELQTNVDQILTSSDTYISLATLSDPVATPVNPTPFSAAADPNDPNAQADATPPSLPGSARVSAMPAAAAPTLNITPTSEPTVPNAPATSSISRQTGTLTIFASERQQRQVQKFIENFRKQVSTQVLIEAKVLEVTLSDEFSAGIDWGQFNLTGLSNFKLAFPSPGLNPADSANIFSGVFQPRSNLNVIVSAISRFGTVRALSSPRVTVLNNEPAVVNVAKSVVYFTIKPTVTPATTTANAIVAFDSTPQSVPEGVLLNVIPRANPDTGEIYLSVRPTVTKIDSFVTDPTVTLTFASAGIVPPSNVTDNKVPQVSVQEMDSLVRLQSGQVMVMGGLMKDSNSTTQLGIPVLGDVPYLGALFRSHSDKIQKSELVILLRAQIVTGSNVEEEDRKIYNTFGLDRRPSRL
jgi:general secretion pathway protein D